MVTSCSAVGCTNQASKMKQLSFHRFPLNDKNTLSQWLHAVKRKEFQPTLSHKLCSAHFLRSDFYFPPGSKRAILKKNAVPSIFPKVYENTKKGSLTTIKTETSSEDMIELQLNKDPLRNVTVVKTETVIQSNSKFEIGTQTDLTCEELNSVIENLKKSVKKLQDRLSLEMKRNNQQQQTIKMLRAELKNQEDPLAELKDSMMIRKEKYFNPGSKRFMGFIDNDNSLMGNSKEVIKALRTF